MRAQPEKRAVFSAQVGAWLFRYRSYTLLPIVGLLLLRAAIVPRGTGTLWCNAGRTFGVGLMMLGEAIRLCVAGSAKPGTSGRGFRFRADALITGRCYAWTRNPLYLANLTIWAGIGLLIGGIPTLAILVTMIGLYYRFIIAAEERFLFDLHGEQYSRYVALVPRLLPRTVRPRGKALNPSDQRSASFSWLQALVREHDTLFAVVAGSWLLLTLDLQVFHSKNASSTLAWTLVPACACVGWIVLKILRKIRRRNVRDRRLIGAPTSPGSTRCTSREKAA